MKDEGKPPEPDETLDAPVYQPPSRNRSWFVGVAVACLLGSVYYGFLASALPTRHAHPDSQLPALMCELKVACLTFDLEYGRPTWPKPDEVAAATVISSRDVYIELKGLPGARINTQRDYLGDVKQRFLKNGALVDTWGHEIMFRVDPKTGEAVIWSCGENGIDETNDGESPDPVKYPKGYYRFGKGDTGDDITWLGGALQHPADGGR